MITVVAYTPEHLTKIEVKEIHNSEVPQIVMTDALTFMDGETPVAIFGVFNFMPGIIHLWGLISDAARKKPVAFHKLSGELLNFYQKRHQIRRIQIDVRVSYTEGQRWAESLGFEREGIMRSFGADGTDYYLYARVR